MPLNMFCWMLSFIIWMPDWHKTIWHDWLWNWRWAIMVWAIWTGTNNLICRPWRSQTSTLRYLSNPLSLCKLNIFQMDTFAVWRSPLLASSNKVWKFSRLLYTTQCSVEVHSVRSIRSCHRQQAGSHTGRSQIKAEFSQTRTTMEFSKLEQNLQIARIKLVKLSIQKIIRTVNSHAETLTLNKYTAHKESGDAVLHW